MSHRPPSNLDHLTIQIDRDISRETFIGSTEQCIDKVHHTLRQQSNDSYDPIRISIGPYHHGKTNLKAMEGHKRWYLYSLLQRMGETTVYKYVKALRKLEVRARRCYVEPITLNSDKFVKLMLLDGCFIIELFRKYDKRIQADPDDKIFQVDRLREELCRDLFLIENQLPFFVLVELFNMTSTSEAEDNIIHLSLKYLDIFVPAPFIQSSEFISTNNIEHLFGLMHKNWCFQFAAEVRNRKDQIIQDRGQKIDDSEMSNKSAMELEAAGIRFKRADNTRTLLEISFNRSRKELEIPFISIDDFTESFLRNMVAYEQRLGLYPKFVTDYIIVLDRLVNTSKDIGILKERGVLENNLGDDVATTNLLNKLGNNVSFSKEDNEFSYPGLFDAINSHCKHRRNVWMATLRRDYFNTPWASVSFLAAVFLLLLTIVQTICSIISLQS